MAWLSPLLAGAFLVLSTQVVAGGELYDAALAGNVEAVQTLLGSGAKIDEQGELGTPLHVAALRGDLAIAEILIAKGGTVNLTSFACFLRFSDPGR
jgi:ankyrin repeat protein